MKYCRIIYWPSLSIFCVWCNTSRSHNAWSCMRFNKSKKAKNNSRKRKENYLRQQNDNNSIWWRHMRRLEKFIFAENREETKWWKKQRAPGEHNYRTNMGLSVRPKLIWSINRFGNDLLSHFVAIGHAIASQLVMQSPFRVACYSNTDFIDLVIGHFNGNSRLRTVNRDLRISSFVSEVASRNTSRISREINRTLFRTIAKGGRVQL